MQIAAQKSYILIKGADRKWHSLINFSMPAHAVIAEQIWLTMKENNKQFTKDELIAMRELLAGELSEDTIMGGAPPAHDSLDLPPWWEQ